MQSAAKPGAMTSISPSCDHYGARLPLTFGPLVASAGFALFALPKSINPRGGVGFDGEERHPQAVDADVVEERSELDLGNVRL
jgi:hypothetical protein